MLYKLHSNYNIIIIDKKQKEEPIVPLRLSLRTNGSSAILAAFLGVRELRNEAEEISLYYASSPTSV